MGAISDLPEVKLSLTNQIKKEIVISANSNLTGCNNRYKNFSEIELLEKTDTVYIENQEVSKTSIIEFVFNAKLKHIQSKFDDEFTKYSHYITSDQVQSKLIFNKTSKYIANINYEKLTLEITPSNAVKFIIIINDILILTITKPFEKISDLEENEVVFNLYKNKELLLSDATEVDNLVKGINSFLEM